MIPLLWFATSSAFAGTSDDTIYTVIDMVYGKPVPHQAVCIQRDLELPSEGFSEDIVAVGITRPNQGCVLYGVFVDGTYRSADQASQYAIDAQAWSAANTGTRESWLTAFTQQVLLSFDHFSSIDPAPSATTRSGSSTVTATLWRRSDLPKVADHTIATFTFDASPALTDQQTEVSERWQTTLGSTAYRVGSLSEDAIHTALEQQGRTLKRCLDDAWSKDLTISGRHRMQFSLSGGSATGIALVSDDDDGSGIERCYSSALKAVEFPAQLNGTVLWSFSIVRRPVTAP